MGLGIDGVTFLLYAHQRGVNYARSATLGRQQLAVSSRSLLRILRKYGHKVDREAVRSLLSGGGYAEGLFRLLGAELVHSFDFSDYEGSTVQHDFNRPLERKHLGRYTAVIDGGTLEHIFDFRTAITNCMKMLEEGGSFLSMSPANNYLGHGFYQFSPELLFRTLGPSNGFQIRESILVEHRFKSRWWAVRDPEAAGDRVMQVNSVPTEFFVLAKRVKKCELLLETPQQSDYVRRWQAGNTGARTGLSQRLRKALGARLPPYVKIFLGYTWLRYVSSPRLRRAEFKRLRPR